LIECRSLFFSLLFALVRGDAALILTAKKCVSLDLNWDGSHHPGFVALETIQIPADGDLRISAGHLNSTSMKLKGERLALTMLCSTPALRAYELPMVS
jgi:hypothetical protein